MHLTLHLTTACNMRCAYCYAPPIDGAPMSAAVGRAALELGTRLARESAAGVQDAGNAPSCGVVFFGGEPLLCKDRIAQIVEYARHRERQGAGRFHFKITTNGLLLDEAWLEYAIHNDILVALSFDGVREAHDHHRRLANGGPSFDLLLDKLKTLLAVRPYSSVLMAVNPETARYLADSVEFLLDLGVRYLIVSLNYAGDWTEADFKILKRQVQQLGKKYIEWTRAGRKFYLSPFEVKLSSHINRHCWQKERCELAQRQISVDPQGYLFPCVQFPRAGPDSEWCIGHVDTGINEDARRRVHDESEAEKSHCAKCALNERCHNTCGCLNWQTTGTINGISPVLCRYEQMLIPIADRVGKVLYKKRDPLFLHKHYNSAYPVLSLLEDTLVKR